MNDNNGNGVQGQDGQDVVLQDASDDRRYFVMVPHIVTLSCDPFELKLWNVIKMLAGETGECTASIKNLEKLSHISHGKIVPTIRALISKGFLIGELKKHKSYHKKVWHFKIPNLWLKNIEWREKHHSIDSRVEYVAALFERSCDDRSNERSCGDRKRSCGDRKRSCGGHKEEPFLEPKEEQKNKHIGAGAFRNDQNGKAKNGTSSSAESTLPQDVPGVGAAPAPNGFMDSQQEFLEMLQEMRQAREEAGELPDPALRGGPIIGGHLTDLHDLNRSYRLGQILDVYRHFLRFDPKTPGQDWLAGHGLAMFCKNFLKFATKKNAGETIFFKKDERRNGRRKSQKLREFREAAKRSASVDL